MVVPASIAPPASRVADGGSTPAFDRVAVAAFMAIAIASGITGAAGYDTTRDVAQSFAIRHSSAWPLQGPMLAGSLHLGPLWFYVLALPLLVHSSWLAVALFVAALSALQFPLAYATGRRLRDRRLGLLWCALLALPGWGSFQWIGFAHTNVVAATVMLVLYTLVRLAQDRKPVWLPLAGGAMSIAVHAHPTALAYAPLLLPLAWYAIRDVRALVVWGAAAIVVALIPFAPLAFEAAASSGGLLRQSGSYLEGQVHFGNLANVPALLYAMLERGPRVVTDAFCGWPPGCAPVLHAVTLAIEAAGVAGLAAALAWRDRLAWLALASTVVVAALIAWLRPVTPFYMTYALLPALAGTLAVGLQVLLAGTARALTSGTVGVVLLLHAATVAGIARTIVSGHVVLPVLSRLDVKQDDAETPLPEPWLAAYAVDRSGTLLCAEQRPVVLHGTYAFLEDLYLGLDRRLHCAGRDVRLIGAAPAGAAHLVGLAKPLWNALGWPPAQMIGGLGVAGAARVLHPASGLAVPDGTVYPPHTIAARDEKQVSVDASVPASEALVVSQPYAAWMPPPRLSVSANGNRLLPLAIDAVSAVYLCRACPAQLPVEWRVGIASVAPERIDVVTIAPPR